MKARQQGEVLLEVTGMLPLEFVDVARAALDPKSTGHADALATIEKFLAEPV